MGQMSIKSTNVCGKGMIVYEKGVNIYLIKITISGSINLKSN